MNGFRVSQIDHVELFVFDRDAAAAWYARTLGLQVVAEFAHWAADPQGPLMIVAAEAGTKLALFTGKPQSVHADTGLHRVAFRVSRQDFEVFLAHVRENPVFGEQGEEVRKLAVRDHDAALSVYFRDPYGNRLEVTTYEVGAPPTEVDAYSLTTSFPAWESPQSNHAPKDSSATRSSMSRWEALVLVS